MPLAAASLWRIWNELSDPQMHQVEQCGTELMVEGTGDSITLTPSRSG